MKRFSICCKGSLSWCAIISAASCWSALLGQAVAYEAGEHQDIATKARANYRSYVAAHPDTAVGGTAIGYAAYWDDEVYVGVVQEDDNPFWMTHFWDPDAADDADGLPGCQNAFQRATFFWNSLLPLYENGAYGGAYRSLGHVMHLVSDMGTPAHVNLDEHAEGDWYEGTYIPSRRVQSTNIDTASGTLRGLMATAAEIADNFDSGPAIGFLGADGEVDLGNRRAGGFTLTPTDEGAEIAAACYPAAIAGSGGLLKLFYDTVKPVVSMVAPSEGDICSGIKGVNFTALAHSYNTAYNVVGQVHSVAYYDTTVDPYIPGYTPTGSFEFATECFSPTTAPNGDLQWKATWTCNINSSKVWVRAVAFDNALCDSLPFTQWIKIDSKRPEVINTRP